MSDIEEITVSGWAEPNDALYSGTWQEPLGRFRFPVVYRGQYGQRCPLTISLHRMAGSEAAHLEATMADSLLHTAPWVAVSDESNENLRTPKEGR